MAAPRRTRRLLGAGLAELVSRGARETMPLTLIFRLLHVLHPVFVLGRCLLDGLVDSRDESGEDRCDDIARQRPSPACFELGLG